jgi:hypothetical protein
MPKISSLKDTIPHRRINDPGETAWVEVNSRSTGSPFDLTHGPEFVEGRP